ncbi:hypothetical protein AAG906_038250 [Vitis piasezkii]
MIEWDFSKLLMRFQYGGKRISLQGMTNPHKQINGNKVERILKGSNGPISVRPYRYPHFQKRDRTTSGKDAPSVSTQSHHVKDKFPISVIDELLDELHAAGKMSVWANTNQVSGTFDRRRRGIGGSAKGGYYDGVAETQDSKGPSRIFGASVTIENSFTIMGKLCRHRPTC